MRQQCSIRWRPSGGRGEFEVTPTQRLADKRIFVRVPALNIDIDSETHATISQGKPRLRKYSANDRSKLHLVQLVMALARLPDPAREDKTGTVSWPLEGKQFVIASMDFDIVEETTETVVLEPLNAKVLHSPQVIDLRHRFESIRKELATLDDINTSLVSAIRRHHQIAMQGANTSELRDLADEVSHQPFLASTMATGLPDGPSWMSVKPLSAPASCRWIFQLSVDVLLPSRSALNAAMKTGDFNRPIPTA